MGSTSVVRYRRIRDDKHYMYLDIGLEFESANNRPFVGRRQYKAMIMSAIRSLFGDFGTAVGLDLIHYRDSDYRAIIRTNAK
ncbi:unnamed protein product [Medioppia subpectinata]|uniref:Uncharacterized protein n=1 Tax=Medioppia subpectinata TaxID=1979941 RepID=A0A7R9KM80_9ACAR|nr:unnamed protein product [Medioppia subpectinata]CAG2105845.1 unnamed protein product [Medioppia subpectinata]